MRTTTLLIVTVELKTQTSPHAIYNNFEFVIAYNSGRRDRNLANERNVDASDCLFLTLVVSTLVSATATSTVFAQTPNDARSRWEVSCMIRHDKFDYVLPGAMRRNDIDLWIVIDRGRGTQPMTRDFGIATVNGQGFYVFSRQRR